ncbi:MAG: hypothetical protein JSU86_18920 [Phycisphaerales bacterium]|nr:MAG: hypothetical protein JSU86_18920 [Phycisphaerales bacterium]
MGARPTLGPFVDADSFLRHVDRKNRIRRGVVSHKVFKDKHETLSFTCQNAVLRTGKGLDQYQRDKAFESGDLPGLRRLTFYDLTVRLQPPLPPRSDPNPDDERYGHLYCCTNRPSDDQREKMAHLAEGNGIVRPFVPKGKRTDL